LDDAATPGPLRQQRALIGRSELESIIEEFAVQGVEADRVAAGQTSFRKDVHTVV